MNHEPEVATLVGKRRCLFRFMVSRSGFGFYGFKWWLTLGAVRAGRGVEASTRLGAERRGFHHAGGFPPVIQTVSCLSETISRLSETFDQLFEIAPRHFLSL